LKNKKIIFIALDCNIPRAKAVIKSIPKIKSKKYEFGLKIGYQIFYAKGGREFVKSIKKYKTFIDLKLNDIPNTVKSALLSIKDLNPNFVTIHASAGAEAIKIAKRNAGKTNLLGVTVLTSMNKKTLKEVGHTKNINNLILHQARLAKKSGCWGIVCSGKEAAMINQKVKINTVTPGVRMPTDKSDDQKRVVTPKSALKNSSIVIGRPIVNGNIKNNFKRLIKHLEE
jgi:orotidine-5'-phosphate decarboxylase